MCCTFCCEHVGFPLVPPEGFAGTYKGNAYFIVEKISRSLSSLVSDLTLDVSLNDLLSIALQMLEILRILFNNGKVLKNLHVNDFFLRRTTRGYRLILLNQDFYMKLLYCLLITSRESFFIDDPTFASISVMSGNGLLV